MKKFFTLIAAVALAASVNAQGTYAVQVGDKVNAGDKITSVKNVTLTYMENAGTAFADGYRLRPESQPCHRLGRAHFRPVWGLSLPPSVARRGGVCKIRPNHPPRRASRAAASRRDVPTCESLRTS